MSVTEIWDATRTHRRNEDLLRRKQPLVRLWDGEYHLQHILGNEYRAQFSFISNDTGPGQIELPFDSPAAQWIHDHQGRVERGEGRNVHITVDHCGARWSGLMDKYAVEQRSDGDVVLVVDFMHDYEHLKWYSLWSNPLLPPSFQVPRAFLLAGPVTWVLKMALFLNIYREHNPLLSVPDDPISEVGWFQNLDQSNWSVVVKPTSFGEALQSGVVWGVLISRWASWHDAAHIMLEDAELSVRCDRYLEGDPPPWTGANLRHGTLVIDIVDKSGIYVGTSTGGTILEGLRRTVVEFADDFIDSTAEIIADADTPQDYFLPDNKYTDPVKPYLVYQEGDNSTIESSAWFNSPAKGVRVAVGGHSMPGVNEVISASIAGLGDLWGNLVLIGGLGGTIDTLLKPLYEDTILAWWSVKSLQRANNSGWARLHEYFQTGSDRAYTVTALMVLRAGFWATKTQISWKVEVADGRPFMIGDRGQGHFFLDDRVGLRLKGDDTIHMDRCRKIDLAWNPDSPPEWQITIGDDRIFQDPAQRAWGKIEQLIAGHRDLGVY